MISKMDRAKGIPEGKGGRERICAMSKIFVGTKIFAYCMDTAKCCSISIDDFVKSRRIGRHSKKLQMQGARMPACNRQVEE